MFGRFPNTPLVLANIRDQEKYEISRFAQVKNKQVFSTSRIDGKGYLIGDSTCKRLRKSWHKISGTP